MVKQMIMEAYYDAKQHKGRVIKEVVLLVGTVLCALWGIPYLCFMLLVLLLNVKIWNAEKEALPEAISFLPMSNDELKRYMLGKTYALSIGLSGILLLSFIYIVLCSNHYVNDNEFWELGIYQVVSFFFYVHIMSFSVERAKMSRTKAMVTVQLHGSLKGEVAYATFLILFATLFFWCGMGAFRDANAYEPSTLIWLERIILWILLGIQFVMYYVMRKMLVEAIIYSDYNAKIARNEEVDYEY